MASKKIKNILDSATNGMPAAVRTLKRIITDETETSGNRISACRTLLDLQQRMNQTYITDGVIEELEQRIAQLEASE